MNSYCSLQSSQELGARPYSEPYGYSMSLHDVAARCMSMLSSKPHVAFQVLASFSDLRLEFSWVSDLLHACLILQVCSP